MHAYDTEESKILNDNHNDIWIRPHVVSTNIWDNLRWVSIVEYFRTINT